MHSPSDLALLGHLPHLANAKQGRLEGFQHEKIRPFGRIFHFFG